MKDDLAKNVLLDDDEVMKKHPTAKQSKKRMSAYEVAQRVSLIWSIVKGVVVLVVAIGVLYGGYVFVGKVKEAATQAVVTEAKDVAKEKYDDAKKKAKNTDLFGAIRSVADNMNSKFDGMVDKQLIEQGYDPEAPNFCAMNPDSEQLKECVHYTDTELSEEDYVWVSTAWKGECEDVHKKAMDLLTMAGKLTYNDQRALIKDCDAVKKQQSNDKLEKLKQQMITGDNDV